MKRKFTCSLLALLVVLQSEAQTGNPKLSPEIQLITPQHPLAVKDSAMRKAIILWSEAQLKQRDYTRIKAHPAANVFPGTVQSGYEFVDRSIPISHHQIKPELVPIVSRLEYSGEWEPIMYSTGLYAVPGQYVEIIIPKKLLGRGVRLQIGAHTDPLNQWVANTEAWRRFPLIVKNQELVKEKTRVASPFGGLIYITADPKSGDWEENVQIRHAVAAAYFKLGVTSEKDWLEQLKNNKAPWGELATDNIIITLPDSVLQRVKNPEKVMRLWDLIIKGEMDLAQIPTPFYREQRLVLDEHMGGGFMHSGYPIMVHHSPTQDMLSEDVIANPELLLRPNEGGANWGFFHEIGHNLQNLDWVFDGTTEVSCNFFTLYMFDRLMGGRDKSHPGVSNSFTQQAMKEYFSKGAPYEEWKKDPFLGLIMFRQLQEGFGWETFKKLFREYHSLAAKDADRGYANTEQKKRDLWVKTFSTITGNNIAPFFKTWGIPISPSVEKDLTKFPTWVPYNFPVVD